MTYNQWQRKFRHEYRYWPRLKANIADCAHCGQEYGFENGRQEYCGESCKRSAQNHRHYNRKSGVSSAGHS